MHLVKFQIITNTIKFEINSTYFTLTGAFLEADIELAKNGFDAFEVKAENT